MNTEDLKFEYDSEFKPSADYLDNMPDLQNGDTIRGTKAFIEKVGISNFRLPLNILTRDGGWQEVEASVVGTVSLEAVKKGINMSRIIRTFYKHKDNIFSTEELRQVLLNYQKDLGTFDAHILLSFNYRIWQESLRSVDEDGYPNGGWQYYKVTLESNIDREGVFDEIIHFDFVYSSACPCSTELSLYAMETRGRYAIPHSQRSIARVSVKPDPIYGMLWIEDIQELMKKALKTETLVFCKREDEMAFAELNAANVKFVEDAVRLVYEQLDNCEQIADFKVIASHNESLHSHDAIAVITKFGGSEFSSFDNSVTIADLQSLVY